MASPTDIRKGRVIMYNGTPHAVMLMLHRTQGRQAGFVQTTLRNIETGSSTTVKFRSTDSVEFCHSTTKTFEYSYADADGFHFMNPETFEDILLSEGMIGDDKKWLVEGASYGIMLVNDEPVSVDLPNNIDIKVESSPEGLRGDTSSAPMKPATLVNGAVVQVPLFVKAGDVIKVRTEDSSYAGRA